MKSVGRVVAYIILAIAAFLSLFPEQIQIIRFYLFRRSFLLEHS